MLNLELVLSTKTSSVGRAGIFSWHLTLISLVENKEKKF